MKDWKNDVCKCGGGAVCCKHLVTNGRSHACNKIKTRGKTFSAIAGASGDNCLTGIRSFTRMNKALSTHKKNYLRLGLYPGTPTIL